MTKKVYDSVEDIPGEGEDAKDEAPKEPEAPKAPEPKKKPCKRKDPLVEPPHLPVGCTHD